MIFFMEKVLHGKHINTTWYLLICAANKLATAIIHFLIEELLSPLFGKEYLA